METKLLKIAIYLYDMFCSESFRKYNEFFFLI